VVITAQTFKAQMVEARRAQILQGAAQVFAQKGFHKATTREIAGAAGISEGTIYNYFDSKRDLLFALIEFAAIRTLRTILEADPPDDPGEFLAAVMADRYQILEQYGYVIAPVLAEIFIDADLRESLYNRIVRPVAAYLEQYIQTQIDSGRFRRVDPVVVTRALVGGMLFNFILKHTNLDSRYQQITTGAMIEQLTSLFLEGLQRQAGRGHG